MSRLEKLLFQLTIFLIPTNLAYHFYVSESYISGILSDYLIPRIYLSDIPILILLFIWLTKQKLTKQKLLKYLKKPNSLLLLFCFLLVGIRGLLSTRPLAATWFWFKLIELFLFFLWIKIHAFKKWKAKIRNLITLPLALALIFQSLLALYQFTTQRSLVGYPLLGEPTLIINQNIAKTTLFGSLRIIPYGTNPHPNILAGFISIGLISLFLLSRGEKTKKPYHNLLKATTYFFSIPALLLTQAASAWLALLFAILLISLALQASTSPKKLLTTFTSAIIISVIFLLLPTTSKLHQTFQLPYDSSSITRRIQLSNIALTAFAHMPIFGIGLNNFTAVMQNYGTITGTTRFFQPVHSIYLLWLTETGLIGTLPVIYLLWQKRKTIRYSLFTIPFAMILLIGLVDHYPLTLQQGQLLLVLSIALASTPYQNLNVKRDLPTDRQTR